MADNTIAETGLKYTHPSVSSVIRSEEIISEGATSQVRLFTAFTSDKGVDNVVQRYTDPEEFIKKTGTPDMKKHGQAPYNIVNWLKSGGEVYGIRVMPENAGFSHAFLNVLTRTETKKARNTKGDAVTVSNVVIKPAIAYTDISNKSEAMLDFELNRTRGELTIDGFKNNVLFVVHPYGRGKAYNDLGFRLTLNKSFDEQYEFRVYNFEVIRYDEFKTPNVVEGPFYVSLDPDALSGSNESMFIEDVVNKYSTNVKVRFNEEAYIDLCQTINPEVDPKILDIITGQTRSIQGQPDVFFSKQTEKFEDVHMSLHRYDANGLPLEDEEGKVQVNMVDSSDVIEQAVLLSDNVYRQDVYNRYLDGMSYMKESFNNISNSAYGNIVSEILNTPDGQTIESGILKDQIERLQGFKVTIQNLVESFNASKLESDFNRIVNENKLVEKGVRDSIKMSARLLAYLKAIETNSSVIDVEQQLDLTFNKLNLKEIIDIRAMSKKDKVNQVSLKLMELKGTGDLDEQVTALPEILSDLKDVIDYLLLIISENNFSATQINASIDKYNATIDTFNALFDPYLSDANVLSLMGKVISELDILTNDLYLLSEITIVNIDLVIILDIIEGRFGNIVSDLIPLTHNTLAVYDEKVLSVEGRDEILSAIRKNIESTNAIVTSMRTMLYTSQLQDYNNPVVFLNGSDGDLDTINVRTRQRVTTQLLSKAYQGLIDPSITTRRSVPAFYILDANYPAEVKNAIVTLVRDIRRDMFFFADTGFTANADQALAYRSSIYSTSTQLSGLFTQDFIVYDEYTGKDIKVTPTFFIASKFPVHSEEFGIQYPMAGNRRGTIDSFKAISWVPSDAYKESLYTRQINYIESDSRRTRFASQLTTDIKKTPLSDINRVLTVLEMKRSIEDLVEDYQFEFEDDDTMRTMEYEINEFLERYVSNRACDEVSASVYASDYDKQQKILRVTVTVKFKGIVERISITIDVVK